MILCDPLLAIPITITPNPYIDIPQTLESCFVPWAYEHKTFPIFTWMSATLIELHPRPNPSSMLSLTPQLHHPGTNFTCPVNIPGMGVTVERTIPLQITYEFKFKA